LPIGRLTKTYAPRSSVAVVCVNPVPSSVTVTVTPGSTPPDASTAVPEMRPVMVWAVAADAAITSIAATISSKLTARVLIGSSLYTGPPGPGAGRPQAASSCRSIAIGLTNG